MRTVWPPGAEPVPVSDAVDIVVPFPSPELPHLQSIIVISLFYWVWRATVTGLTARTAKRRGRTPEGWVIVGRT